MHAAAITVNSTVAMYSQVIDPVVPGTSPPRRLDVRVQTPAFTSGQNHRRVAVPLGEPSYRSFPSTGSFCRRISPSAAFLLPEILGALHAHLGQARTFASGAFSRVLVLLGAFPGGAARF